MPNLVFKFTELFPAFNWAKETGNLLSIWFGVSIFSPSPCCCLLNSRIFSTISNISFGFLVSFFYSLISSVSSFKSLNPLSVKPTRILFFFCIIF